MARTFLRLAGKLWENGVFEAEVGWETQRIARRVAPDPDYRLELVAESGEVLVEGAVELRVASCRDAGTRGMGGSKVVGYVPLHPDGCAVVFRRAARVLCRVELARERPIVRFVEVTVGAKGRLRARWEAEHDRPLWFSLVFIDGHRRALSVARDLRERQMVIETAHLPGGAGCVLAVLATDGLRSAVARSDPFDLPEKPPRLAIVIPVDGETLAPDQPISLLGHAHDLAGCALPDEYLTWSVDGQVVARGQRLAPAGPLAPGHHRIALAYLHRGGAARAELSVSVSERSPEQEAWLKVSQSLMADGHNVEGLD